MAYRSWKENIIIEINTLNEYHKIDILLNLIFSR